jgi:hypothetical protein
MRSFSPPIRVLRRIVAFSDLAGSLATLDYREAA